MIWLQFAVVLAAIVVGARIGGVGLGTVAMVGVAVLTFGFGLPPSSPPVTVLAIIVAVVTATAAMEAAGGMDWLVGIAERALRLRPGWITFVGPLVAYLFTFCAGTGHVAYSVLPVIAEVSRKAGIRPERPMAISVIASQQAITASPLSAATAGMIGLLGTKGVTLGQIMAVCVPSTLCGVVVGAIVMTFWGKPLDQDPEYRRRLEAGELDEPADAVGEEKARSRRDQIGSVVVFLLAAVAIVLFGMVPGLRPTYPSGVEETTLEALSMPQIIQIVMYSAAAVMMLAFGARPEVAVKTRVATAGVIAVVSIVGLGWMGNCFFEGNRTTIVAALADTVTAQPWLFAVALFALSVLLFSQASTVAALMPLGLSLGLAPATLVASFPAVNGYFFLPTYGTIVTAVAFDRTGTTRIGRYVLNHSFMLPGMISTVVALAVGAVVARWVVVAG